jgi:hypothetical protein
VVKAKGKKRKQVERSFKDEKGYFVTEMVRKSAILFD